MNKIDMTNLGLTERFTQEATLYEGLYIGRVSSQSQKIYKVITEAGELIAEVSGKMRYEAISQADFPAVGDFVMLDRLDSSTGNAIIHQLLARKSSFERKAAGTSHDTQIVATNIDTVFICMALNKDYNIRRLERYLSIAWDSRAMPVVVLTKSDLCDDIPAKLAEVSSVAMGVDILVTTSISEDGYSSVQNYLSKGKTVAFIGSSGVGKSTLINRLVGGERLETNGLRNDDKGRHTTTRRELIVIPDGGAVIDTPGMRELGLESADFSRSFADIDELAHQCKFRDCSHEREPGCAVRAAIEDGVLSADRLASYKKLKREATYEGLGSKQIEKEKLNHMFAAVGGVKGARKLMKQHAKKRKG